VTATFAASGALCKAHITDDSRVGITDAQVNPILNELAPEDVRGKFKLATFLDTTCLKLKNPGAAVDPSSIKAADWTIDECGQCAGGVSENYERVTITKYGNTNAYNSAVVAYHHPECGDVQKALAKNQH
jgi:hypothetical protein